LCFAKDKDKWNPTLLPRTEEMNSRYKNPDNDPKGPWKPLPLHAKSGNQEDFEYEFKNGYVWKPPSGTYPRYSLDTLEKYEKENKIWFGKDGKSIPSVKNYLSEIKQGVTPLTVWRYDDVGHNHEAREDLKEIFDGENNFDTPKPVRLIDRIIHLGTEKDAIVLDAFAGSGTTAQALLEKNEKDGGNRRFILIQMPEDTEENPKRNICRDITRERVIKVIEEKIKDKDIGFEYKRIGQPIDSETILSGHFPTYVQLAKYVFYLATGQSPKEKEIDEKKYFAGKIDHTEVYLLYKPDMEELKNLAITFDWAKEVSKGNENRKIVYAPACFMDDEYLQQFNMRFVSIPYNLFERETKE
jgi:adenine-specific DNA-methyltransferase